ncbi:hypothetical protein [Prosthecomicrobium sp. N25]|uniref:hypothetical protein n=1 Tax=Prosthecomicrobium sp. N25 TaxID=3129254 RepID=UPI0030775210
MTPRSHATRPLRAATAAGTLLLGLALAGCEERIGDDLAFPTRKPERARPAVVVPPPVHARPAVAPGASWLMPDRYRSNCAPTRC